MRTVALAAVLTVALLLAACGAAPKIGLGRVCTDVGCDSSVEVVAKDLPSAATAITLCKREKCKTERIQGHGAFAAATLKCSPHPATFAISVLLRDGHGGVVQSARTVATLEKQQP